ncbi:MAG: precorrin-4 C11-methyltransferase [Candidatus Melainabacteria bacterium RIFOXYA2_FULL_32_9]|nr:MAG: precorrin-4 C11-methyltransferase [Candidatus Melainabacteria bacterium RIFOXYA2_FULL_32_9]
MNKVIFIGAGPGDPKLITVKAREILESAKVILYTGSLVPREVLSWAPEGCLVESSEDMSYQEIFDFIEKHIKTSDVVRVHTGDPSIYSTTAKQIKFLDEKNISYEVIPGVTAAFGAAASLGIEYTIPGVSQTLIISRVEGKTPNPENLESILSCKNSSKVFYLSVALLDELYNTAKKLGYSDDTPCWIVEKATWPEQAVIKGVLSNIHEKVKEAGIKRTALILFGDYLYQEEKEESHLYNVPSGKY